MPQQFSYLHCLQHRQPSAFRPCAKFLRAPLGYSRFLAAIITGLLLIGCGGGGGGSDAAVFDEISTASDGSSITLPPAFTPPPELPAAPTAIWPFEMGAPKTSGMGRYAFGAYYWTDFLYDATGAKGSQPPPQNTGSPTGGSFVYPAGDSEGNGADIFRIGIGADNSRSYWRVDWLSLKNADIPVAAFILDYEEGGTDALTAVPGIPNLRLEGTDAVLLISSAGAFLATSEATVEIPGSAVFTDESQGYLIAHIPTSQLSPSGTWNIQLASGLNDGSGGFDNNVIAFGGQASQPPVFNLGFRSYEDEAPLLNNFWLNEVQSQQLSAGTITSFGIALEWERLGETEAEPFRYGYSNRWYVSALGREYFGRAGVYDQADAPNVSTVYFDQVQPYGIYIPQDYTPESPHRFSLMLHSFTQNHNQYSATMPNFQFEVCEEGSSICLTTLGRGPAGFYQFDAEVDLFGAWADVNANFNLDPERSYSTGYSMGAIGTIQLMSKYPDLFAGGVVIAGAPDSSIRTGSMPNGQQIFDNRYASLENLKWNGYYHTHGNADQLVPINTALDTIARLSELEYRYQFDRYQAEDHIAWTLKDAQYRVFTHAAQWLVNTAPQQRKQNPGEIIYQWLIFDEHPELGVGPTGAWWISELDSNENSLTGTARVHAISGAIPEQAIVAVNESQNQPLIDPPPYTPATRDSLEWTLGDAPAANGTLSLVLDDVDALTVDLARAGIASRDDKQINALSSQPVTLKLTGLSNGTSLSDGSNSYTVVNGQVSLSLPSGESEIRSSD